MLEGFLRNIAVSPILFIFFVLLFIYVMRWNYIRLRQEKPKVDLLEDEELLDQVDVDFWFMRIHTVLTNKRVIRLVLSWFLSKRKAASIALQDIHSVKWRCYTNWLLILVGLCFLGLLNPLVLVLVLLGLQAKVYLIRFNTPFAQMPLTRIVARTLRRRQLNELWRFYQNAQIAWAKFRLQKGLPASGISRIEALHDTDFAWGRPVWVYLAFFFSCGLLQRILELHISFDDYFFLPLYLGLLVAIAQRNLRDAIWASILGFTALFTLKFPGMGLLFPLVSDGRAPYFEQYGLVVLTLLLMVILANFIARYIHYGLSFLAIILWLGFVGLHMPVGIYDLGLYAKLLLAMAAAILLAQIEKAIGFAYGTILPE